MAATKKSPPKKAKPAAKKTAVKKVVLKKAVAKKPVAKKVAATKKPVKVTAKVSKPVKAPSAARGAHTAPVAKGAKPAAKVQAPAARAGAAAGAKTGVPVKAATAPMNPSARPARPERPGVVSLAAPAIPSNTAPVPVATRTAPEPSTKDLAAAHEYLLARSATRSEAPVTVNGKRLPTEGELLKMPDSEYMNDLQLAFFKHRLQQMERELLQNADETTEHLRETVIVPDPADRATIEEEHALELRTRDRERKLLKKVQQSIAAIDSGDYGYCEETGEPIGVPRLLARPTATLSLEAQERREMKQKMYGD